MRGRRVELNLGSPVSSLVDSSDVDLKLPLKIRLFFLLLIGLLLLEGDSVPFDGLPAGDEDELGPP